MAKPNIILILADDMGYGDFGVFNDRISCTPHLDCMVEEGICLTQQYAASPVCAPSRAGLFTGRYPHRTGAVDTFESLGGDRIALREKTIADFLKRAGYRTGLIGKWHNGALDARYHPNARGFDEFIGFRGGWHDYYKWFLEYNGDLKYADGRYLTDVFSEEAVQFIKRHRRGPFFLHLAYNAPHFPMQAPEEDIRPFLEQGFGEGVAIVYAMIKRMDAGIGRISEALQKQGLQQNTIVIFSSDNGPAFHCPEHLDLHRFNCNYNGRKGNVYEGGIRVPMILRWPDGFKAAQRCDAFVHFCDMLPTILDMAGLQCPRDIALDGVSVLAALQGDACGTPPRRFWQWNRFTPVVCSNAAMRDGPWKLVRPVVNATVRVPKEITAQDRALKYDAGSMTEVCKAPLPMFELPEVPPAPLLFNLDTDPGEQDNLADAMPQRTVGMIRELETWFESVETDRRAIHDVW